MTVPTAGQFALVYNAFSFAIAVIGAATIFLLLSRLQFSRVYRTALTISEIVTLLACYHYFNIFNSWAAAYTVSGGEVPDTGGQVNHA
jgi:hypothetical protein